MEFPSISYLRLLRNLSEAIRVRESVVEYNNLLQVIFEEKDEEGNTVFITSLSRDHDELSQVMRPDQVLGRNHEKEQLLSQLMYSPNKTLTAAPPSSSSRPQLHVISILGVAGIGKTTLARLVYDDEVVKDNFSLRAWVRLGGQGFSLMHVAKELLKSASGISYLVDDLDELDEMVRDALKLHRCLIVFDEIESITNDSWLHMIRYWFNFVDLGSKVLVTTHSKDVADLVADQTYELTQLSDDAGFFVCIYLAERVEFIHSSRVAENLAALCRGIPLLSKLMGCLMRYDERINNLLSTMDLSNGDLMPFWDESIVILLSIWALPQHLRQCLFFCAAFPKGYALDKEKIIESWIAHGIIKKNIGDAYIQQLLSRSFFTDVTFNEYGDIAEFQMPDMIHNIAQNVARIVCGERLGLIGSISENASRLSLVSPSAGKYDLEEDLQMLILSSTIYLNDDLDRSLIEFKDLRSLDLSCSGIRSLTDDICALKELRCLNLSYTFIEELPNSITQLSRLQTLGLSWCYHLKVLPERMRDLVDLRRLDLRHCESLSALPSGIGLLISLNSMPLFVVGKDRDSACLDELQTLDQLRGRLEIRNLENVKEITEAQDSKLDQKNILHLVLFWSENADDCFGILQCLKPNPYLEVLDLSGYMGIEFPPWISSIYGLTKISINNCGSKKLPSLGHLPLLKELQLKGMSNIEYIGWEFYGDGLHDVFPCLENLGFYDMPGLLNWSTAARSHGPALRMFRSLKTLTIEGCHQLPSLPSLPTLTDLIVWNSKTEILSSLTSFKSLSSILVNDVELGSFFEDLSRLKSLKKLILFNIKDVYISSQLFTNIFFALEYLSILHCHQLRAISLSDLRSLQKLHIVDCLELNVMVGPLESKMIEFVIEDCPREFSLDFIYLCPILRKLTVKNCPKVNTSYLKLPQLEGVEYLFIRGCPQLQKRLQMDPSIVSHIPCVMLGDDKVDEASSKDSKDSVNLEIEESAVKFSTGDDPSLGLCFSNEESKEFVKFESEDSAQVEISTGRNSNAEKMGKKGSWFSAIKRVFTHNSKERPPDGSDKKSSKEKKKGKGILRHGETKSFIPLFREPSSIEKILGEADQILIRPTSSQEQKAPPALFFKAPTPKAASPKATSPRVSSARLTSPPKVAQTRKGFSYVHRPEPTLRNHHLSATKIQAAYRGYLARRNFRALRGLVRLQGVVRGQNVKNQTMNAMKQMQLLVRVQTQIQSRRIQMLEIQALQRQPYRNDNKDLESTLSKWTTNQLSEAGNNDDWDDSVLTKEEIEERLRKKVEAVIKRERSMAYAYSHQLWKENPKSTQTPLDIRSNGFPWWWSWLERQLPPTSHPQSQVATKQAVLTPPRPVSDYKPSHQAATTPEPTSRSRITMPSRTPPPPINTSGNFIKSSKPRKSAATSTYNDLPLRDDDSLTSCPPFSVNIPNYMSPTVSAKAKVRANSNPKERLIMGTTPVNDSKRRFSFSNLTPNIGPFKWNKATPKHDYASSHKGLEKHQPSRSIGDLSIDSTVSMPATVGRRPFNRFV